MIKYGPIGLYRDRWVANGVLFQDVGSNGLEMSIRGKGSYSRIRRPVAPAPSARESAGTPEADADRLIAMFGLGAYAEARRRQRQARASEAAAHWAHAASLIARRASERRDDEIPTRAKSDARPAGGRENLPGPWPIRFFDADPLDELERVLAVRPQCFRLQFFGAGPDLGPLVLSETEIEAADASSAIRAAAQATWPARAVGLRVLDLEGREIFERLKADL